MTPEIATRKYAYGALRAFLEETQNLNWLLAMIRNSGVQGTRLAEVFENLRHYGSRQRYEEALAACRQQGWLG